MFIREEDYKKVVEQLENFEDYVYKNNAYCSEKPGLSACTCHAHSVLDDLQSFIKEEPYPKHIRIKKTYAALLRIQNISDKEMRDKSINELLEYVGQDLYTNERNDLADSYMEYFDDNGKLTKDR